MPELPAPLARRVADGHHHVLRSDIDAAGLDPHVLRRWVRAGHLEPLGHGEYVILTPPPAGLSRFDEERIRHLHRCEAVLAGNPELHLVGPSAAVAHGLPLLTRPRCVVVSGPRRRRPNRSLLVPRMPWGSPPKNVMGLRCQDAAETVIEISAVDGVRAGLLGADAVAHQAGSTDSLATALDRFGLRPGVRQARRVVGLADPRIESPGESLTRLVCDEAGIELEPQVTIRDGAGHFVARVDFLVTGTNVVVEFDGLDKYASSDVLHAEKRRQLAVERLGYRVVRLTWADLERPQLVVATITEAIRWAA